MTINLSAWYLAEKCYETAASRRRRRRRRHRHRQQPEKSQQICRHKADVEAENSTR